MRERSYPYAVSRVKALESTLINLNTWNRLYESDVENCYKILNEINYGSSSKEKDINLLTQASVNEAREFIKEITPDEALTNMFLYKIDGQNIKAILKGLLEHEDVSSVLLPGGSISIEELNEAFEKDTFENFPLKLQEAVDNFNPEQSPLIISSQVDQAVFNQVFFDLSIKKNFNELIKKYFETQVHLINILTVLRARNLKWSKDQTRPLLLDHDNVSKEYLLESLEKPEENIAEYLSIGEFKNQIMPVIQEFLQTKRFFLIETKFLNISYNIVHESYADSFGIGPLINYLLEKEFEARSLRVLFAYKNADRSITLPELGIK